MSDGDTTIVAFEDRIPQERAVGEDPGVTVAKGGDEMVDSERIVLFGHMLQPGKRPGIDDGFVDQSDQISG